MKTLKQYLLVAMFLIPFAPAQLQAAENNVNSVKTEMLRDANKQATLQRLKAIRALSKTNLSKSQKHALREEVKAIRDRHTGPGGVVYISTGALILILVLLIILL